MLDDRVDVSQGLKLRQDGVPAYVASVSDGILVANDRGRIVWVNGWICAETGYSADDLLGQAVERLIPAELREKHVRFRETYQHDPQNKAMSARPGLMMLRSDGSMFEIEVELNPLSVADSNIVIAVVRNARQRVTVERQLARTLRHHDLVATLSELINNGTDLDQVYKTLADLLKPVVPYDRLVVSRLIDDLHLRIDFVAGIEIEGMNVGRVGDTAMKTDRPEVRSVSGVLQADTSQPSEVGDPRWDSYQQMGFKSWMETPLGTSEEPIGYISVRSKTRHAYDSETVNFFPEIGRQLGSAIRNNELNSELRSMVAREAAVAQIGRVVSSTLDLDTVWEEFVGQLRQIIPADRIVITKYSHSEGTVTEGTVTDTHVWGVGVADWERGKSHLTVSSGSAIAIRSGKPTFEDLDSDALANSQNHLKAGLKSGLYAPLFHQGETIGSLNVKSMSRDAYSENDLQLLQTLANQIAGAIAAVRMHAEVVEAAELRENQIKLEAHNEWLARESSFKSELISTVSHELRTPLTGLVGMADVLHRDRDNTLTERQVHQIQVIRKSGKMLFMLTSDLLTASSVEAGKLEIRLEPVNVSELFETLERTLTVLFGEKRQQLEINGTPDIELMADSMRLEQMVANLLSNASKYSPEHSKIVLSAVRQDENVIISVQDRGDGIAEENLEQLFATYFRSDDKATRSAYGTGLGLYIVKTLAEAHKGKVTVESVIGSGSTFRIELPSKGVDSQVTDAA